MNGNACPLCGSSNIEISIERESQGMDGSSYDWTFSCRECNIIQIAFAADNFYGRKYFETVDEAAQKWNETCEKYSKSGVGVISSSKGQTETELEGGGSTWWYVCGECHGMVDENDHFCRHCGSKFKRSKN